MKVCQKFTNDARLKMERHSPLGVLPIGHDNYKEAIDSLLQYIPQTKFECDKIISPLDMLQLEALSIEQEMIKAQTEYKKKLTLKNHEAKMIEQIAESIGETNKQIKEMEQKQLNLKPKYNKIYYHGFKIVKTSSAYLHYGCHDVMSASQFVNHCDNWVKTHPGGEARFNIYCRGHFVVDKHPTPLGCAHHKERYVDLQSATQDEKDKAKYT